MKTLMHNIKWDEVPCHICKSTDYSSVKIKGQPLVDGQFGFSVHPVICKSCGLVYLSPRWSKKVYNIFYQNYYDELYRLEIKPDYGHQAVVKNMAEIWDRIKGHLETSNITNVLDVGCAYGFGLKHLKGQMPHISLFGIESSPEGQKSMQSENVGATLITHDFDLPWEENFKGKMDLIILRHVFEHVLDPLDTLKKLNTALSPNGAIYFAVPDIVNVRTELRDYDDWWEYIFRPVHTYYYSKETFIKTLEMGGLYPIKTAEEKEEIWCVAKKEKTTEYSFKSVYPLQVDIFNRLLPQ